jgi:tetratricopeptide (TPR) repeat protein
VLNRSAEANVLLDAMTALLPDDPVPPYLRAIRGSDPAKIVGDLEMITRRFPTFAPAFNILAYQRWAQGDRDGAFAAVQEYVRLAPAHPNSHDSYAEILQFAGRLPEALQHYQRAHELDPSFGGAALGIAEVHMLMGHPAVARAEYAKAAAGASTPAAALSARAAGSLIHLLEGKPKDALRELGAVTTATEQQNFKPQAAAYHRMTALVEALFGDRGTVAAHLAKAAELGGADAPAQLRFTALANAVIGRVDLAAPAAAKYEQAMANGTLAQQRTVRELNAVLAISAAEQDVARAQRDLAEAGAAATLGKAILAQSLAKAGRKTEAQALKAEILSTTTAAAFDVLARGLVRKV